MDIWLIEDGKRTGPFQDYEVRERIDRGELTSETKAWHRDQQDWLPLKEVAAFETAFEENSVIEEESVQPSPLPPPPTVSWGHTWMRFLARWIDFILFQVILIGGFFLFNRSPFASLQSGWFVLSYLSALVLLEALALSVWRTTPGKWIAGIRVVGADGEPLALRSALGRALRVLVLGMGLSIGPLLVVGHLFALWFLRKRGLAPWDFLSGARVELPEVRPERVVAAVGVLVTLMLVFGGMATVASFRWFDDLPPREKAVIEQFKRDMDGGRQQGAPEE